MALKRLKRSDNNYHDGFRAKYKVDTGHFDICWGQPTPMTKPHFIRVLNPDYYRLIYTQFEVRSAIIFLKPRPYQYGLSLVNEEIPGELERKFHKIK